MSVVVRVVILAQISEQ